MKSFYKRPHLCRQHTRLCHHRECSECWYPGILRWNTSNWRMRRQSLKQPIFQNKCQWFRPQRRGTGDGHRTKDQVAGRGQREDNENTLRWCRRSIQLLDWSRNADICGGHHFHYQSANHHHKKLNHYNNVHEHTRHMLDHQSN